MGEQKQPKTGWLARWRERRREKTVRASEIQHRSKEAQHRDALRASKNVGTGGGGGYAAGTVPGARLRR
jgi:hypothetical protein